MVSYEIYCGTVKYLSYPVATNTFSEEVELPRLTLCQYRGDSYEIGRLHPFNLTYDDYMDGQFFPHLNTSEREAEDIFQDSLNDNYYLLDVTGNLSKVSYY